MPASVWSRTDQFQYETSFSKEITEIRESFQQPRIKAIAMMVGGLVTGLIGEGALVAVIETQTEHNAALFAGVLAAPLLVLGGGYFAQKGYSIYNIRQTAIDDVSGMEFWVRLANHKAEIRVRLPHIEDERVRALMEHDLDLPSGDTPTHLRSVRSDIQ